MKEKPINMVTGTRRTENPPPSTRHRVSLPGCVHIPMLNLKKTDTDDK